jgi:hypothetical protein
MALNLYCLSILLSAILAIASSPLPAQTSRDACVRLNVETLPGGYYVRWDAPANAQPALVRTREVGKVDWEAPVTLSGPPYGLLVEGGYSTEVSVEQQWTIADVKFIATGYVVLPQNKNLELAVRRGRALVLVEQELMPQLSGQMDLLADDLYLEGFTVDVVAVPPGLSPESIKNTYIYPEARGLGKGPLTHLLLIGRIPYATSGGYSVKGAIPNPDFHPEHGGAWASDAYYADLETSPGVDAEYQWTDDAVNITDPSVASRQENRNVPGDGKFDASMIPTDLELCVGRLDFQDLPAFGTGSTDRTAEVNLLRAYLDRDHQYRIRTFAPPRRAVVDDNFGLFTRVNSGIRITEAFASSAWRSFSPIVGERNIVVGDWVKDQIEKRPTLDTFPALLAYGCGGGGYDHCDYAVNTTDLAATPVKAVFTLLFGSYFGDVNSTNNVLRATLANNGWILTCGWSGRPHWFMHELGAGATIGECFRTSANNGVTYMGATYLDEGTGEYGAYPLGHRGIQVMLLGDPTLALQGPTLSGPLLLRDSSDCTTEIIFASVQIAPFATSRTIHYVVEAAPSRTAVPTIVGTATTKSADPVRIRVRLPQGTTVVRVRPFGSETEYPPYLPGRGLSATRPVNSVADSRLSEPPAYRFFDLLGRPFAGPGDEPGRGLWLRVDMGGAEPTVLICR